MRGDPAAVVSHVATLASASSGALAFLANPQYRTQLGGTQASAVVLGAEDAPGCPVACLISANAYLTFARIAADLHPPPPLHPGLAAGAFVGEGCQIGAGSQIEPAAVIGSGTVIGERVYIGPGATIGAQSVVGDDTRLMAGSAIYDRVRIGRRCLVHSGVVIGADGFGFARESAGSWVKVPQLGAVVIGDDVEIGANTTIDRGAIENTVIGDGVKLDNQIQIGHNVVIGAHTALAACSGISGSSRVGARCVLGGRVSVAGHITIADDVVIGGGANVTNSIKEPGVYGGAIPFDDARRWRKNAVRFSQLDGIARRLQQLENTLRKQGRGEQ